MSEEKEECGDKGMQSFWRHRMACIFDVGITDSDAASIRVVPIDKVLEKN